MGSKAWKDVKSLDLSRRIPLSGDYDRFIAETQGLLLAGAQYLCYKRGSGCLPFIRVSHRSSASSLHAGAGDRRFLVVGDLAGTAAAGLDSLHNLH